VAGFVAKHGGPLKGLGEAAARGFERDPTTPGFVRDRLHAERLGRQAGRVANSILNELDD